MGTVCHTIILARVAWVALCCIDDVEAIQSSWCDSVALDWLKSQKVALHASTNFRLSLQLKLILDNNSVDQSFQLYSGWLDARLRFYWWQICGRSSLAPPPSPESIRLYGLWRTMAGLCARCDNFNVGEGRLLPWLSTWLVETAYNHTRNI